VDAEQVEGLVVATAAIAAGVTMLVVEPGRLPPPLSTLARKRYWAIIAIVAGVGLIVTQLVR
jgi:hypothetical protein